MSTDAGETEEEEIEESEAEGPLSKLLGKVAEALWKVARGWRAPKEEED